jgi:hypothetical protein
MIYSYEGFKAQVVLNQNLVTHCSRCEEPFSKKNVHSRFGWYNTQIGCICEDCFDYSEKIRLYSEGFCTNEDT